MVVNNNQLRYYERSRETFTSTYLGNSLKVNADKYRKWADINNYRITHCGIYSNNFQNSVIAFDYLYSRLSSH